MSLDDDCQETIRLIEYSIVSIEPTRERVLPHSCGRCLLITGHLGPCELDTTIIADYVERYRLEIPTRYLRVSHRVLGRWPRQPLHYEEKQLGQLRGIGRAIRGLSQAVAGGAATNSQRSLVASTPRTLPPPPARAWPTPWQLRTLNLPPQPPVIPGKVEDSDSPATKPTKPRKPRKPRKPDDLTEIDGVGPKIAKLLRVAGLETFAGLAEKSSDELNEILDKAGPRYRLAEPSRWPRQAQEILDARDLV